MGAILFIILSVLLYTGKILLHARNLTFDKWSEIFISFFIFTNCVGFGLPLIDLELPATDGAFGFKFRLEVFMIILPVFFIIMARRTQWQFLPLPWYTVLFIALFCAINLLNPNNMAINSTVIAMMQLFSYLLFLYLICSCVSLETLLKGIFEGFVYTSILQTVLTICYPILDIYQVVTIFREEISIRSAERPGAPGTFAHPNVLGGYMAYVATFFTACYLLGYQKRKSLIMGCFALFVIIFTFSRSALIATIIAIIGMIVFITTKNSSIFSLKNILTRILPLLLLAIALVLLTPLKDSFIGSNVDDMFMARMMHYYCGYETFTENPWFGVGFNAHLEYIRTHISSRTIALFDVLAWKPEEFIFSNPIHNIFFIFLSEFGIIGTLPIFYYIGYKLHDIKPTLRSNATQEYKIFALFAIGLLLCLFVHGMSDWAPLNPYLRNIWIFIFFITAVDKFREPTNIKNPQFPIDN